MADKRKHFIGLDGFRGIAAILVAAIHVAEGQGLALGINNFQMAVDFFFLLSGFVIGLSYEKKILDKSIGLFDFVKIRLVRLYPIIFLAAIVGVAWRIFEARFPMGQILLSTVAALLVVPVPRPGNASGNSYPINGPSWSLTYELLVNVLFAACARFLRGRALWVAFVAAAILEAVISVHAGRLNFATGWGDQLSAIVRATAPFLLGVILYRVTRQWHPASSNAIPVVGACVLAALLFAPINNVYYNLVCIFLLFPCLILAGSVQPRSAWITATMAVLGEISYPLYAINQPLVRWLSLVANSPFIARFGINPYVDLFARLLLMCGLALVISRFYDLPVRAALRRLVATRPNSKKAAAMP